MKFINKIVLSFVLAGSFFMTSCDDLLQVDPRQSIDANGALNTPDAVGAALNSVYARLRPVSNYGRDLLALSDALADVGQTTSNSGRLIGENNNQPNAHFGNLGNFWANSYFAINEANLIIDGLPNVQGASAAQLARWEGEAKFLRALYYFDLIKVYSYIPTAIYTPGVTDEGGIPLVLEGVITSDAALARQTPRSTIDQVYTQIYADLEAAKTLLTSRGTYFASSAAASALLSRVALYRGDWAKAADEATTALASNVGTVLGGQAYVNGWRAEVNPESMFEVRFAIPGEAIGVNESLQTSYTTLLSLTANKNSQGGWGDFIPNATVRGFFGLTQLQIGTPANDNNNWDVTRNDDVRAFLYTTGNTVRGAGRQIECIKFASKNGFAYGDNVPVIRKSEMHLNRAEANYHIPGNEAAALTELNAFKALRGLAPVTLSGQALLDEILLERFKEFAFEGHRWFDLKRYGKDVIKTTPVVNLTFDDFKILPPIPQREVDGNPNLNQNRGY
ncbi:RagB/SusD family nutrient uptake outer membrane protein [Aquiflexum gelatinilyticum]|uniref:RagB/SusD family nutrient uptake outer membrane protein n=1 Tax=Aquiflexum gelatinilyticum TaxID=2961943 RepID=A0A9X2P899_9BACT|nr:RagB/SusD family nutrient uptake outer membrane protein [Aquiflexum gelatinilyticum]MCR9016123.1 RagB/SusD family nutrient uptake outer membrane protein [Aquiflexum gelatinilyticum]